MKPSTSFDLLQHAATSFAKRPPSEMQRPGHIASFRWRGTFLKRDTPRTFRTSFMLIPNNSSSFQIIPFHSKYIYIYVIPNLHFFIHTCLGYVKDVLKDILIISKWFSVSCCFFPCVCLICLDVCFFLPVDLLFFL